MWIVVTFFVCNQGTAISASKSNSLSWRSDRLAPSKDIPWTKEVELISRDVIHPHLPRSMPKLRQMLQHVAIQNKDRALKTNQTFDSVCWGVITNLAFKTNANPCYNISIMSQKVCGVCKLPYQKFGGWYLNWICVRFAGICARFAGICARFALQFVLEFSVVKSTFLLKLHPLGTKWIVLKDSGSWQWCRVPPGQKWPKQVPVAYPSGLDYKIILGITWNEKAWFNVSQLEVFHRKRSSLDWNTCKSVCFTSYVLLALQSPK